MRDEEFIACAQPRIPCGAGAGQPVRQMTSPGVDLNPARVSGLRGGAAALSPGLQPQGALDSTAFPANSATTQHSPFVTHHSSLVIALDAGGTKTACLLARADDGAVLGRGVGGPGNIHAAGAERVAASLADAVRAAFQNAGLTPGPVAAVALGAAGAARPDGRAAVGRLVRASGRAGRYA